MTHISLKRQKLIWSTQGLWI